ncbi:MAG: response regulator transcription factor [Candidatus Omnitrophota bacterium]
MPKPKIVLVEDEPLIATMVKARLEANDYEVLIASNGLDGLQLIRKEIPDLAILDVMLPRVNGYQICAMVKANPRYNKVPIIMLTACAQESDKDKGRQCGADAYITKPFEAKELLATIKRLIDKKGGENGQKDTCCR